METDVEGKRTLFHRTNGGIDFARMFENAVPMAFAGVLIVYSNSIVTQGKVEELSKQILQLDSERKSMQLQQQASSERLIALSAQVTAYLGQQTTLNASMDARLIYIERAMRSR